MKPAVVIYAPPTMGHIVSMTELGKLIHHNNPHLSITIIHGTDPTEPPTTSAILTNLIKSNSYITFHPLPTPAIDTTRDISPAALGFETIRLNAQDALSALREISTHCQITAFVIDMFCSTALSLATDELGIPTYIFFTSGAAALAACLYMPEIAKSTVTKNFKDSHDLVMEFPGLPPIPAPEMPEPFLVRDDPAYDEILFFCTCMAKSKGILVNTFDELEPVTLAVIRKGLCVVNSLTPPVYTIGPVVNQSDDDQKTHHDSRHECLSWLDTQPARTVVFLCFGSRGVFTPPQIIEIAKGLEKSGQRFLWVVKSPENLPEGFLDRTKEIGIVVSSWVPQVEVLRHLSVGGFVTHCGWNSVLEAVVAGQPMVAWPLYAEQHLNRAVLVKDMGLAIGLVQGEGGFVSEDEVARCVVVVLDSKELREKSADMKEKGKLALGTDGTSMVALKEVMQVWSDNSKP